MKDNVKRMRRQATDWEKIFAKDTSEKRLLSKIYKELSKLNSKKKTLQTIQTKTGKKYRQTFYQRGDREDK